MDRSCGTLFFLLLVHAVMAAPPAVSRIPHSIDENQTSVLRANVHPAVAGGFAADQGPVPGSQRLAHMSLHFSLTPAQQADLDQLLAGQQNRRSPQFHKFLSPEQFAERFGLSPADLATVTRWLEQRGFSNIQPARARTSVSFSGSASQAQAAFRTHIHKYSINGESYFANTTDPQLPQAFAGVAQSIGGLNNFRAVPMARRAAPRFGISNCNPSCNVVAPADWAAIYGVNSLYSAGFDGTGVNIAIVGQSDVTLSDLRAFRAAANLPAQDPTVIIPPGDADPGIQNTTGDEFESELDLEWAGAIAKNANLLFVTASTTAGNGVTDSITYAIDQNLAPIVSVSYGYCESASYAAFFNSFNTLLAQATAQGMTIVAASGDNGPACNLTRGASAVTQGYSAGFPASSPNATAIGGSEFTSVSSPYWVGGTAISYIPERVWNDGLNEASGGGASSLFSAPAWQIAPGIPNDGWRDFPDLAFTSSASVPVLVCFSGSCVNGFLRTNGGFEYAYGTSAAAPPFAGILALVVQKTGSPLGNINPNLYSLAQIGTDIFHDIVLGNNNQNCSPGTPDCSASGLLGYPALTGYDQATGWGSINAYNFAEQWSGDIQVTASPTQLTLNAGSSATSTITVTPQNNFSGPVTLTCSVSSSLIGVSCAVPSTPINTSGSALLTITAGSNAGTPVPRRFPKTPRPFHPLRFVLGLTALCALTVLRLVFKRAKAGGRRPAYLWIALAGCLTGAFIVSCGNGSSGGGTKTTVTPLAFSCAVPSPAVQNVAFNGSCTASGGTAPYNYLISLGSLPSGLSLNAATGVISGTPNSPGLTSFTVNVFDSSSPQQQGSVAIPNFTVNATGPLALNCPSLSGLNVGALVNTTCSVTGATPPATFVVSSGALPNNLIFNSVSGGITGTPAKAGSFSFTLKATDSSQPAQSASRAFAVTVAPPLPLTTTFNTIQVAQANVNYSQTLVSYGGLTPYTYSITSGSLPAGLVLNPSGIISGMPQAAGVSPFSLTVTDSYTPPATTTVAASFFITPPPPENGTVTITATSGGIVNTVTIAVSVP